MIIAETKAALAEKKYEARVAQRQERVHKASLAPASRSKYTDVRYSMVNVGKPKYVKAETA